MDLKALSEIPPWDWPDNAADVIETTLRDRAASIDDRLLAATLVGEVEVMDNEIAGHLLAIAGDESEPVGLRGRAVIAFGPTLEYESMLDLDDDDDDDDSLVSPEVLKRIAATVRALHDDPKVPSDLRRAALEASVRAAEPWHADAVRAAYQNGDPAWRLTAVFCMRFIEGFDDWIIESLAADDPIIHFQAVCAAGDQEIEAAWPQIVAILEDRQPDRDLLLAALDAAARIHPAEASELLEPFAGSKDQEIAEVATDAIAMARAICGQDDEDY